MIIYRVSLPQTNLHQLSVLRSKHNNILGFVFNAVHRDIAMALIYYTRRAWGFPLD